MNKAFLCISLLMSFVPSGCTEVFDKLLGKEKEPETNHTENGGGLQTQDDISNWPAQKVAEEVSKISPAITTVVPEFESSTYTVNYNSIAHAVAINGFDYPAGIVETYKQKLENSNWAVSSDDDSGYNAISPDQDIKIDFYIDTANNNFSVDVFAYVKPVMGWPEEDINRLLGEEMAVTGVVPPYEGQNNGFEINTDYFPYAIYVYVNNGTQEASAAAYNQQLLNAGYQVVGDYLGDDIYSQPGTTLGLHGVYLAGNCFTIELFDITMIFED